MRLRRILALHLASSNFFAWGTIIPSATYTLARAKHFRSHSGVVEFLSWTLLCCHVLPEIIIDLNTFPKAKRKLTHMRYGTGPCTNFVQSILFAACCIFQGIYFSAAWSEANYQNNNEVETQAYELFNLIAGHMWLLSGLISLCGIGSTCCPCKAPEEQTNIWEKVANDVYFSSTVLLCLTGYVMLWKRSIGHVLHILVRGIWTALGTFYLAYDLFEGYSFRNRDPALMEESRKRHRERQERLVDEEEG